MNSRRLARLMGIICDIKANPRRSPDEMCRRFSVSRRQFYKDRDTLARMGFGFHYARGKQGFLLDKELTFNVSGLSLADLFALILAVRELTGLSDFGLAMGALAGLRRLVEQLPAGPRELFQDAVDEVVVADGFGCPPEVLRELEPAINQGRRVVLVVERDGQAQRLSVDPRLLTLKEGRLSLEADGLEGGRIALAEVRKVIATPFFSPRQ